MITSASAKLPDINTAFYEDVMNGLGQTPKSLPCKWFYDEKGSRLFEAITHTDEYYLTRVESMMLPTVATELKLLLPELGAIIEPGSGSSQKTRTLLSAIGSLTHYLPMDISTTFLLNIANMLKRDYPWLQIIPITADFTALHAIQLPNDIPTDRLVFFPGSTIGNFSPEGAKPLLKSFHRLAGEKGSLLIGIDATQKVETLLSAYNDKAGITAQFNLNLLVRANDELGANFDVDQFKHQVRWVPENHRIEMHLVSTCAQTVTINQQEFAFNAEETIFTESCYKYPQRLFESIASASGWRLKKVWQDSSDTDFQLLLLEASH